jgi:hypothetical protein
MFGTRNTGKSAKAAKVRLSFAPFMAFRRFRVPNGLECPQSSARLCRPPDHGIERSFGAPVVLPDQHLVFRLLEKVRAPSVSPSRKSAIRSADDISFRIVEDTVHIAALGRNIIDNIPVELVAIDGLRRIADGLALKIRNQAIDPIGIPVLRGCATCAAKE